MPNRKRDDARKLAVNRLCLAMWEAKRKYFGTPDHAMVFTAIGYGRITGRPLDVSGIAASVGISRQAVLRHLKQMQAAGEVTITRTNGRSVVTTTDQSIDSVEAKKFLGLANWLIRRAAMELSETDT